MKYFYITISVVIILNSILIGILFMPQEEFGVVRGGGRTGFHTLAGEDITIGSSTAFADLAIWADTGDAISVSNTASTTVFKVDNLGLASTTRLSVDGGTAATSTIKGNLDITDGINGCYFIYGATTTLECY